MPDLRHEEELEEELAASRPTGAGGKNGAGGEKESSKPSDGREEPYDEEPEVPQK
jgi:hypothetical protein